jgi:multidrug transporter EmrE-like cation transporter
MKRVITAIKEWNMQTVAMVLVPVLIGVVGQICLKYGMAQVGKFSFESAAGMLPQFVRAFSNIWVLIGFAFYFLSSLFWMIVLSKVDLSVAYPLLSMGYVFVLIASWMLFREPVTLIRWVGVFVIMFGVTLISRS